MRKWKYSSIILDLGSRGRLSGKLQAPAALPPAEIAPVPIGLETVKN
jgi:hypothetical protein